MTYAVLTLGFALISVGCREVQEGIQVYRVPKEPKQRMLAAMVPHGSNVWIFKVMGSDERVAEFESEFKEFLTTVEFGNDPDAEPTWKLNEGWKQLPDDHARNKGPFPRFATVYKVDSEEVERMEVAVSSLPKQGNFPWRSYVKFNVDRWRQQVGLPEVAMSELDEYTTEIPLENNLTATYVNFVESDLVAAEPDETTGVQEQAASAPADADNANLPFEFEKPESWSAARGTGFSLLSLQAGKGDKAVGITVTAAGGGLLPNVNRWRGQIGLGPIDDEQLADLKKTLAAGNAKFDYFQLVGPERTILAAIAEHGGRTWFITLKGKNDAAKSETENFEAFVKSIQFKS